MCGTLVRIVRMNTPCFASRLTHTHTRARSQLAAELESSVRASADLNVRENDRRRISRCLRHVTFAFNKAPYLGSPRALSPSFSTLSHSSTDEARLNTPKT